MWHDANMTQQHNEDQHVVIHPQTLYFGTPIVLLSTLNPDGSTNLAPMSSAWALGTTITLGMNIGSRTALNLKDGSDLVVNLADQHLQRQIQTLGQFTGNSAGRAGYLHGTVPCHDKYAAAGLTPQPSELVKPDRVEECPIQIECHTLKIENDTDNHFLIIQAQALRVHAASSLLDESGRIDPELWKPLIYDFRQFHTLGPKLG